jgi:hypothetical protein
LSIDSIIRKLRIGIELPEKDKENLNILRPFTGKLVADFSMKEPGPLLLTSQQRAFTCHLKSKFLYFSK